jgi:hypothetical protein
MTLNKEKVMQALLSADSNVPTEVISYVGSHLNDGSTESYSDVRFDHSQPHVFEACGVVEQDARDLTYHLNTFMNSLPKGEQQQSKAVEFLLNSGNKRWLTLVVIAGLQKTQGDDDKEDLNKMILKALMRKLRDKDEE